MPPKLTEEERIASNLKKAEYAKNWRIKNAEKFDAYMHDYYIENKKLINDRCFLLLYHAFTQTHFSVDIFISARAIVLCVLCIYAL